MPDPKVLMTDRGTLDHDVTATTPGDSPNIRVVVVQPIVRVLVRVARTYLQSLLAFLGLAAIGGLPGPGVDPTDPQTLLTKLALAAGYALAPAVVSLIQNVLEVSASWDTTQPELRG
jgi:hypothetical protein